MRAPAQVTLAEPQAAVTVDAPALPVYGQLARIVRIAILALCDVCGLAVAALAAYGLWALPERRQSLGMYVEIMPLLSLFLLGYAQAGLYPGLGLGPVERLRRTTYATTFSFLVLAALSFALKLAPVYSRATFLLAFVFSLVTVPMMRAIAVRWSRHQWCTEPVAVVGTGIRAARVIRRLRHTDRGGYHAVAVLAPRPVEAPVGTRVEGVPVFGGLDQAREIAAHGVRIALLETDRANPARERSTVERLQRDFRHVVLVREYDDLPIEGLQIRNLGELVGIEYTNNLLVYRNQVTKRVLDIALGTLALLIAAPVIFIAALLVRLLDGGPAFFIQDRAGLDGRRIAVPKIRTMRRDAEQELERSLAADPELRREWETHYKLKSDPRLIPVIGQVFRRFSIDELPQLWTVLRGDMSLVGPRPFPDYHMQRFSPSFLELRRRVRPGITGLWQTTVRSAGGTSEQESYDSYYIRNWSVWLDFSVLTRTIAAVASGRGAY